jgi:hypothetical protein
MSDLQLAAVIVAPIFLAFIALVAWRREMWLRGLREWWL